MDSIEDITKAMAGLLDVKLGPIKTDLSRLAGQIATVEAAQVQTDVAVRKLQDNFQTLPLQCAADRAALALLKAGTYTSSMNSTEGSDASRFSRPDSSQRSAPSESTDVTWPKQPAREFHGAAPRSFQHGHRQAGQASLPREHNPRRLHIKQLPYRMLARIIRCYAEQLLVDRNDGHRGHTIRCKSSDTQFSIEFADIEHARVFYEVHLSEGTFFKTDQDKMMQVQVQWDAPWATRKRNWV